MKKLTSVEQLRQHVRDAISHQVDMARSYHRSGVRSKKSGGSWEYYRVNFAIRDAHMSSARITKRAFTGGESSRTDKRRLAAVHARYAGGPGK